MAAAIVAILTASVAASAQRVRVSPHEIHEFDVAGCHITFDYGRPSKKGRVIWGGLVPYGRWWMPGADEASIVTTTKTLVMGDLTMPAGAHTLYMLPDERVSKLIVSNETGQFHTVYHPNLDLGRIDLSLRTISTPVEQLTLAAEPRPGGGALTLTWDDREYSVAFVVK